MVALKKNKVHVSAPPAQGESASIPDDPSSDIGRFANEVRALGPDYVCYAANIESLARHVKSTSGKGNISVLHDVFNGMLRTAKETGLSNEQNERLCNTYFTFQAAELVPPPDAVLRWQKQSNGEKVTVSKELGQEALEWLKRGLLFAHLCPALSGHVKDLLGAPVFTKNLSHMKLFKDLKMYAHENGLDVGRRGMKRYFDKADLGVALGKMEFRLHQGQEWRTQEQFINLCTAKGRKRRDSLGVALGKTVVPEKQVAVTVTCEFESELVYIHLLRMVAVAVDADFQRYVTDMTHLHHGECKSVPIKGTTRMWNKLHARDDHRQLPPSLVAGGMNRRSGQNIDIVRNCSTFETVDNMKAFICAMEDGFDGVARAKNMFAFNEARAEQQLHYRTIMVRAEHI
jgi:hypothetical protein